MRYLLILISVVLLIFFGLPDAILYAKGLFRWLPFIIIFLVIPFLSYKTLREFKIKANIASGISIGSVLLIGPLFGIWTGNLSDKDLEKNGKTKIGIVSEKWYATKRKGEWLYKVKFNVNNTTFYTFSKVDKDNRLKLGDTVLIKYSSRNPENSKIVNE